MKAGASAARLARLRGEEFAYAASAGAAVRRGSTRRGERTPDKTHTQAAMKHVRTSPEEKPCAACKRPTARTVVSEGRAHRFCSVECASSRVRIKACRLDGVEVDVSF